MKKRTYEPKHKKEEAYKKLEEEIREKEEKEYLRAKCYNCGHDIRYEKDRWLHADVHHGYKAVTLSIECPVVTEVRFPHHDCGEDSNYYDCECSNPYPRRTTIFKDTNRYFVFDKIHNPNLNEDDWERIKHGMNIEEWSKYKEQEERKRAPLWKKALMAVNVINPQKRKKST